MKLSEEGLAKKELWQQAGYVLPAFDRKEMIEKTKKNPYWIHFGGGNIFKAFQANVVQNLLNKGILDRGLIVAEGYDYEIVEKMNRPHQEYAILATLKGDGQVEKTVIGSIAESCILDRDNPKEFERLEQIFAADSLQMVSFTITEKGYALKDGKGNFFSQVAEDFEKGPGFASSYMGKVTALLYARYKAGQKPVAMVSMDNCSHNGDKLYQAVTTFAQKWVENGLAETGFLSYLNDKNKVSFPWSMIDKITPRPDAKVEEILQKDGVEDLNPVITGKNTYVAPFVNAEECEYLVIEDWFPNGRPALEEGGVYFTDRETVDKVEKMKVCTCLNPLHTALAIYGCLLGYTLISAEMEDKDLVNLIREIGYVEGLPVVVNPGILDPKTFLDAVMEVRLPNPFMPDAPQRIATDTSQKLAIRFGETIKAYLADPTKNVADLQKIPLVFAGWLRYLMAIDDQGNSFTLSADPLLEEVCPFVSPFVSYLKKGEKPNTEEVRKALAEVLSNEKIFGVNLVEVGMDTQVCNYFVELIAGPGAVRKVLGK